MIRLAANLSMLFPEHDFLDRFGAAAKAGFRGVEYLFPYAYRPEDLAGCLRERSRTLLFRRAMLFSSGRWLATDQPGQDQQFA